MATSLGSTAFALCVSTILFDGVSAFSTLAAAIIAWTLYRELKVRRKYDRVWTLCVWTGMLGWLTTLNILRMHNNWASPVWELHISGSVMLMVIKYTSLSSSAPAVGIIDWLGWTFFLPSFFSGPTLELNEYLEYLTWAKDSSNNIIIDSKKTVTKAFWYLPFIVFGSQYFPIWHTTSFQATEGSFERIAFVWLALWCIRCRYYFAWKLAEASYQACGASSHTTHFGRNVHIWNIEIASSVHEITSNWNICSAKWLKVHVYQPLSDYTGSPRLAITLTNVISAVWHGLSPGYFLTFISVGICTAVGRLIHTNIDPLIPKSGLISTAYSLAMTLWLTIVVTTIAIPFQLFTFEQSWEAWKGLFFIGHIWVLFMLVICLLIQTSTTTLHRLDMSETKEEKSKVL